MKAYLNHYESMSSHPRSPTKKHLIWLSLSKSEVEDLEIEARLECKLEDENSHMLITNKIILEYDSKKQRLSYVYSPKRNQSIKFSEIHLYLGKDAFAALIRDGAYTQKCRGRRITIDCRLD
jgi:hypothetical protein